MKTALLVLLSFITLATAPVSAGSIWNEGSVWLFRDQRAYRVGDTITVLVMESAQSSQSATTDVSRNSNFKVGPGSGTLFRNIPGVSYSGDSKSKGEGSTTRSSNLITQITATVREVLPNGNLLIEGERELQTNEEKQRIRLSGTVRPADVSADNRISSTSLADMKIEMTGKGPIGARQKEGIFTQIIRLLF